MKRGKKYLLALLALLLVFGIFGGCLGKSLSGRNSSDGDGNW